MNKTFVIGDIHGAHIPLQQCLIRCGFDQITDKLITLGDICDGWPYVKECVDTLLEIDSLNLIGNHDEWFHKWLKTGIHPDYWDQGGAGTARSYLRNAGKDENEYAINIGYAEYGQEKRMFTFDLNYEDIPPSHISFFKNQHLYYKDDKNRLFVHAGFDKDLTLKETQQRYPLDFYWDRKLWPKAMSAKDAKMKYAEDLTEIFIGHSATAYWTKTDKLCPPMHADIIWNLDTGAGSTGRLTIMDVDTHEYWQSDLVNDIYGDYKPRG